MIIFLIHTVRNYIIITNLQRDLYKYSGSTNYSSKQTMKDEERSQNVITQYYRKGDDYAIFIENNTKNETIKLSMYKEGKIVSAFTETAYNKTVELSEDGFIHTQIYNYLETDNIWQTILGSIVAKVKKDEYDGKDVYVIKNFTSPYTLLSKDAEVYVEKDTGILVQTIEDSTVTKYEYIFDNVDDTKFIKPNLSEYKLNS